MSSDLVCGEALDSDRLDDVLSESGLSWEIIRRILVDKKFRKKSVDVLKKLHNAGPSTIVHEVEFFTDFTNLFNEWRLFYKDFLGLDIEFSNVFLPPYRRKAFSRILIVAKELLSVAGGPYKFLLDIFDKDFKSVFCDNGQVGGVSFLNNLNLEKDIIQNDRWPDKTYGVWTRDIEGVSKDILGVPLGEILKNKITGMTFLESLLFDLKWKSEKGAYPYPAGLLSVFSPGTKIRGPGWKDNLSSDEQELSAWGSVSAMLYGHPPYSPPKFYIGKHSQKSSGCLMVGFRMVIT